MNDRSQFARDYCRCMVCLDAWRSADFFPRCLEVHEIARGPARKKAIKSPAAWLLLCRQHHDQVGNLAVWPIVRQLALKRLRDPERYDRVAVNVLRGRAPEAITEADVDVELESLIGVLRALGFCP